MHSHKAEKVIELLSYHMPHGYSGIVAERARERGIVISKDSVRKIKSFHESNLQILNMIIELAQETKALTETETARLDKLLS